MLYWFPLADVMLCMDPEQEGRVYFEEGGVRRLGEGVRGGAKTLVIYVVWTKLCILSPIRSSYNFLRDVAQKQVSFQMI